MGADKKLVSAADLLDSGGESAVTLRAVAHAVGVSHNAPYRHPKDRSTLLAAVAIGDFTRLTDAFVDIRQSSSRPMVKLRRALETFIGYEQAYPARYRLLLSSPNTAPQRERSSKKPLPDPPPKSRLSSGSAGHRKISRAMYPTLRLRGCYTPPFMDCSTSKPADGYGTRRDSPASRRV